MTGLASRLLAYQGAPLAAPGRRVGGYAPVEVVVTVKAYPVVSQSHGKSVCVAGIRTDADPPHWARLWPIPFRSLPATGRFKKYQRIHLLAKPGHDGRPETLTPDIDSIQLGAQLPTTDAWKARRRLIEPLVAASTCEVQRRQRTDGTSLAAVRPAAVTGLVAQAIPANWTLKQEAVLNQLSLVGSRARELEKVPFAFKLIYRCSDSQCRGHEQSIIDWEIGEAYRSWRGLSPEDRIHKIRDKWLGELCSPGKDTLLFIGNMKAHPANFLVLGIFWPPRLQGSQLSLLA